MKINTIIFDLGGVIINLDEQASFKALRDLSPVPAEELNGKIPGSPIFQAFETNRISAQEFRNELRQLLQIKSTDDVIDHAWNSMLREIPMARLDLMYELKQSHKIVVLSNTNFIHINAFNKIVENVSGHNSLDYFADHICYSCELNMRKPDIDIYQKMLEITETNASQSLFLDDKTDNLEGAASVGINTMHVTTPDDIFKVRAYVK